MNGADFASISMALFGVAVFLLGLSLDGGAAVAIAGVVMIVIGATVAIVDDA